MRTGIEHLTAPVTGLVGDRAGEWDRSGLLPAELLRGLGADGLLCAEVPAEYSGLGLGSREGGEFTAHLGSLCSSLRSIATSQGMAAGMIGRLGTPRQQAEYLPLLTGGELAAVAFSEPEAGSDLAAITTQFRTVGDSVVVDGQKKWTTGARYADHLVVVGRYGDGAAAAVVPAAAPGVAVEPIPDPLGCRAAGHADVRLESVRLPAAALLGGESLPLPLLVTAGLNFGRMSVAWGCVGILRACLSAAADHAKQRQQFGKPLAQHQLVARHLAELYAAEQIASRACEYASGRWDAGDPEAVTATILAKHISATHAARGAAAAVQVLASAGARDGHTVARAHRDAKLMEIIEGSSEVCQLMLADKAQALWG